MSSSAAIVAAHPSPLGMCAATSASRISAGAGVFRRAAMPHAPPADRPPGAALVAALQQIALEQKIAACLAVDRLLHLDPHCRHPRFQLECSSIHLRFAFRATALTRLSLLDLCDQMTRLDTLLPTHATRLAAQAAAADFAPPRNAPGRAPPGAESVAAGAAAWSSPGRSFRPVRALSASRSARRQAGRHGQRRPGPLLAHGARYELRHLAGGALRAKQAQGRPRANPAATTTTGAASSLGLAFESTPPVCLGGQ